MSARSIQIVSACVAFLGLAGCAAPIVHDTPSGKAEATFDAPPDVVKPILVNVMTNGGFTINRDTNYQMAFDKPVNNVMMAALMGSRYNAIPDERITYTFAPLGGQTRVVADIAVITNPGSGFEQVTALNNGKDSADVQTMLNTMHDKLSYSGGHSLHVLLSTQPGVPITITTVLPNGPAERSGFKAGDIISEYNGIKLTSNADLVAKITNDTASDGDFTVNRAGETIHLKVHFASN